MVFPGVSTESEAEVWRRERMKYLWPPRSGGHRYFMRSLPHKVGYLPASQDASQPLQMLSDATVTSSIDVTPSKKSDIHKDSETDKVNLKNEDLTHQDTEFRGSPGTESVAGGTNIPESKPGDAPKEFFLKPSEIGPDNGNSILHQLKQRDNAMAVKKYRVSVPADAKPGEKVMFRAKDGKSHIFEVPAGQWQGSKPMVLLTVPRLPPTTVAARQEMECRLRHPEPYYDEARCVLRAHYYRDTRPSRLLQNIFPTISEESDFKDSSF